MGRLASRACTFAISSALAVASFGVVGALPASAASTTWHVRVGGGNEIDSSTNRFYVNDITVHPGDTVEFEWGGFHTVTFNPPANSSIFDFFAPSPSSTLGSPGDFINGTPAGGGPGSPPPPPFDVTIGSNLPPGNYHYRCSIHQFMKGVVRVTKGELESTDAQNIARGAAQRAADEARAVSLDKKLTRQAAEDKGEALVGAGDRVAEFIKFYPSAITVGVGDELTFTDRDLHEPHTVTFGPATGNPQDPTFGVFPSGPGNPEAYDGVAPLNSGYLLHESQYDFWNLKQSPVSALKPTTQFSVTFTKPGSYPFYCLLHGFRDPATGQVGGMSGTVTVLPSQGDDGHGDGGSRGHT
jgi:plastocyanin